MRKTKIVCTIGPVTQSEEMIKKLMEHGMDVARFNFSHGSYEYHKDCIEKVRKVASELNLPVAAMMDTKGPEVRTTANADPILYQIGEKVKIVGLSLIHI